MRQDPGAPLPGRVRRRETLLRDMMRVSNSCACQMCSDAIGRVTAPCAAASRACCPVLAPALAPVRRGQRKQLWQQALRL